MNVAYSCITEINDIKKHLGNSRIVAFDFETAPTSMYRDDQKAALDPAKSHIVGCSFSISEGTGIYVPIDHLYGKNIDKEAFFDFLESILTNPNITKVAHNIAFESMMIYAERGVIIQAPVYDTMCAAQMTTNSEFKFRKLNESGLKLLAKELCNENLPSFTDVTGNKNFDELDAQDQETIRYGCADSDIAFRLYNKLNSWFREYLPAHLKIISEIESPTAVYLGLMKKNGLPINQDLLCTLQKQAENKLDSIRNAINSIVGNDVEIGENCSTTAFREYLFNKEKLPVVKTSATGKEALDDAAIQLLKEYCDKNRPELSRLFDLVQEYRKWGKLYKTYIIGYQKYINSITGCIHPDIFALSTDTGRMSCSNPNVQNMPRATNDPLGIRNLIQAPDGWEILSVDYSQIELRVGAFYCRDKVMMDTYLNNGDIHAATTSVIFGVTPEEAKDKNSQNYKEHRTIAKNVNFGTFYGLFPKGLRNTLKFNAGIDYPIEKCQEIIDNLKAGYKGLSVWQEEMKDRVRSNGFAETFLGRRRYLPDIYSDDWGKKSFAERCALNTPIQGTAADILKIAICRILSGLPQRPWLKPVLQIHDELTFLVSAEKLDEAISFIRSSMEKPPFAEFDLPLIAESSFGKTFGHLQEIERSNNENHYSQNGITMETEDKETVSLKTITDKPPNYNTNFLEETDHGHFDNKLETVSDLELIGIDINEVNKNNKVAETAKISDLHNEIESPDEKPQKVISAYDIINCLYFPSEDIHLRIIDDKKRPYFATQNLDCKCCDYLQLEPQLKKYNDQGRGIFYVVNSGGHDDKSITRITAQFVEMDEGSFAEQQKKIDNFPLSPSFVIRTRRSLHVYWIMDDTAEVAKFRETQQMLVKHFSGDPACVNPSRVMRLPGFNHCKTEPIPVVCIDYHPERIYSQIQLIEAIPESEKTSINKNPLVRCGEEDGLEVVLTGCEFIKHCAFDAATLSEPEWYAMITNLSPFHGGVEAIHELSKPYPGYSKEMTDEKINHFLSSNTGPMTCKTISEKGYICQKLQSGECKCKSPASSFMLPLPNSLLKEIITNLPVTNDFLADTETARKFVKTYLTYHDTVTAEAVINSEVKNKFGFNTSSTKPLIAYYKQCHRNSEKEKNKKAKIFDNDSSRPWYEFKEDGIRFKPGILASHLSESENFIHVYEKFHRYKNGVYIEMADKEVEAMIQKEMLPEETKYSQIEDTRKQLNLLTLKNADEINQHPLWINVKNGIYDLSTNKLYPHTPEFLSTVQVNGKYDVTADCPVFKEYLKDSMDGDLTQVKIIQQTMGYCLIPVTYAQKAFIYVGEAGSGKSVLLDVISKILLGEKYVSSVTFQDLGDDFKTNMLTGKLANIFADLPTKNIEDNGVFKALVGGDLLTGNPKNKQPYTFRYFGKLIFSCNNLPDNHGDHSEGFYRRLLIVRFSHAVPKEKIDPFLFKKLEEEANGILMFAIEGAKELIANNFVFPVASINEEELQRYRENSDSVLAFVRDRCIIDPLSSEGSKALYTVYKQYCVDANLRPYSDKKFIATIESSYKTVTRGKDPLGQKRVLRGIRLIAE